MDCDVLIIGGGPAGLTAGLYASRAGLKTLIIEKANPGGQMGATFQVDNYPGFDLVSGSELSQRMEKHARKFGAEILSGAVSQSDISGHVKKVTVEGQGEVSSSTIIVSSGAAPKMLGVPGEERFRGMGVSYCATCDGPFFRDQDVVVVGGGDSALEEGLFLVEYVKSLSLIHRRTEFRAQGFIRRQFLSKPGIRTVLNTVVTAFEGDDENGLNGVRVRNVVTGSEDLIPAAGAFIYIGNTPSTGFLDGSIELDDHGYIVTDKFMRTSVPGVFAVGDVRANQLKQVATAVGEGAIAAVEAEKYILLGGSDPERPEDGGSKASL